MAQTRYEVCQKCRTVYGSMDFYGGMDSSGVRMGSRSTMCEKCGGDVAWESWDEFKQREMRRGKRYTRLTTLIGIAAGVGIAIVYYWMR